MNILVTGAAGRLGRAVCSELMRRGHEVTAADRAGCGLDITDARAVKAVMAQLHPDAVINCAAWTDVNAAERPEHHDAVWAVNAFGPGYLAEACAELGAAMVHISTDYVFAGSDRPIRAACTDFKPLNAYGASKLEGERRVCESLDRCFIVRTQWLYDDALDGFTGAMLRLGRSHEELRVVCDQLGTPTYTPDLACFLAVLAETDRYGVYHAVNSGGAVPRSTYAEEIFRQAGIPCRVVPVTTADYGPQGAARPLRSELDLSAVTERGFDLLPDWRDALSRALLSGGVTGGQNNG